MERLTQINGNNEIYCIVDNKKIVVENIDMLKICQRLKLYEDLDEQGLLLRLPCKIGDTIWDNDYGKPCAYAITGFSFGAGEDYIDEPVSLKEVVCYYSNYSGSITGSFAVSEIGKTVFLTKEEAEKNLKEMGSDNNGTME